MTDHETDRDRWGNRFGFIMASVGAAIGFGNVWRFPGLAYEYGGGAFFIPYLVALIFIGIPILVMEIALGQFYQAGDSGVFISMHKRLGGTGLASITCGYFVTVYYVPLISWVINAFFDSFTNYPWDGSQDENFKGVTYFTDSVIGASTVGEDMLPTRLVWANVGYLFLSWACVYGCIMFGVKAEGYISYFTMGFPIVLLFIFLGLTVNMPGSEIGIQAYIGEWDLSVLTERPDCWSTAVSQIFFSIGVTFGIMTAFGSHCDRNAPAFANSVIIALANSFFSFISGFMIFAAVGNLSYTSGYPIGSKELSTGGFGLVFGTVPAVLNDLPGGRHWVRLFFLFLFFLGIDSAFALTEACVTVIMDTDLIEKKPRWQVSGFVCGMGFLLGLMYVTDAGLNLLDVIDYYINFIMILVGFFETYAVGWAFDIETQVADHGILPVVLLNIGTFLSVIVASLIWFIEGSIWGGFVALAGIYLVFFIGVVYFLMQNGKSLTSELHGLYFNNITKLVNTLSPIVGFLPLSWAILIKHIITPILMILFINLTASGNFGTYGGYPVNLQVLGIIAMSFAMFLFLLGVIYPAAYNCFKSAGNFDDLRAADQKALTGDDTDDLKATDQKEVEMVMPSVE